MATIYWITETYLKDQTVITQNVDTQMIIPLTQTASDLFVSIILGQEYYEFLLAKYNAQTLTADEILLVDHIQPMMAWRSAEMALGVAAAAFTNKGAQTQSGDFSAPADFSTLSYVRTEYRNYAEYYANRVVKFLQLNEDDYPGWTADSNKIDTPPDESDNWDNNGMMIV